MTQKHVYRLVLEVVRDVARGRPVDSDTDFSDIGIGPWQRQRFFGPLRDAFNQDGVDVTGAGVTRECFTHYRTLRDVQVAIWKNVRPRADAGERSIRSGKSSGRNSWRCRSNKSRC